MLHQDRTAYILDQIVFASILGAIFFIPFTKSGIEVCVIIGIILTLSRRLCQKNFTFHQVPLARPLMIYLLLVLLSLITVNPKLSLIPIFKLEVIDYTTHGLLRVLKYAALYWIATEAIQTEKRFSWLLRVLMFSAFLACVNGLYQFLTGWDFRHAYAILNFEGMRRVTGSFNHPNNFATYLVSVILILVCLKERSRRWSIFRWILLPFLFAMLILTKSRVPLLLLFALLGVLCMIRRKNRGRSILIAMIALGGLFFYSIFDISYFERLLRVIYGDGRWYFWKSGWALAREHLFFGYGINTFMYEFSNFADKGFFGTSRFTYAHNFPLHMLVEIGLIGLLSFLYFLVRFFMRTVKLIFASKNVVRSNLIGIIIALSFFLMHGLVDNNFQSLQLLTFFWILVGSTMGMTNGQSEV